MSSLSRRSFVLGAAATGALASAGPSLAQFAPAAAPQRFSSVVVDVSHLHAQGLGPYAEFVRTAVLGETRQAFADRLGGRGPRLVVRITSIFLSGGFSGGGGRRGGGGPHQTDTLDGEALIVGPRGEILARYPQLSATSAASGGAWYDPASEHRRVVNLAQHYAGWLRRTIPG
jgi:hypothetical protein